MRLSLFEQRPFGTVAGNLAGAAAPECQSDGIGQAHRIQDAPIDWSNCRECFCDSRSGCNRPNDPVCPNRVTTEKCDIGRGRPEAGVTKAGARAASGLIPSGGTGESSTAAARSGAAEFSMLTLYKHSCPAIACPVTGETVVVFADTAAGWSRCMSLLREVQAEIAKEPHS